MLMANAVSAMGTLAGAMGGQNSAQSASTPNIIAGCLGGTSAGGSLSCGVTSYGAATQGALANPNSDLASTIQSQQETNFALGQASAAVAQTIGDLGAFNGLSSIGKDILHGLTQAGLGALAGESTSGIVASGLSGAVADHIGTLVLNSVGNSPASRAVASAAASSAGILIGAVAGDVQTGEAVANSVVINNTLNHQKPVVVQASVSATNLAQVDPGLTDAVVAYNSANGTNYTADQIVQLAVACATATDCDLADPANASLNAVETAYQQGLNNPSYVSAANKISLQASPNATTSAAAATGSALAASTTVLPNSQPSSGQVTGDALSGVSTPANTIVNNLTPQEQAALAQNPFAKEAASMTDLLGLEFNIATKNKEYGPAAQIGVIIGAAAAAGIAELNQQLHFSSNDLTASGDNQAPSFSTPIQTPPSANIGTTPASQQDQQGGNIETLPVAQPATQLPGLTPDTSGSTQIPGYGSTTPANTGSVLANQNSSASGGAAAENVGKLTIEAGDFSASERYAAQYMTDLGNDVVLRSPTGTRASGGTSDLLVNGVQYDVYTPTTANPDRIISAIAKKNTQATGIVVDLSNSPVTPDQLGDILKRVQGAGAKNITDVKVIGK